MRLSGGSWRRAAHLNLLSKALVEFVGAVLRKESPRLLVTMPPRHGKSELVSHWFPVWVLEHFPSWMMMLISYGAALAGGFGEQVRNTLEEHEDQLRVRTRGGSRAKDDWRTNAGGRVVSVGLSGPLTGKGAHILVVDDPYKEPEEAYSPTYREKVWRRYQAAAYTRLEPGGGIIIVQTRWHTDDLAGRVLQKAEEGGEHWIVLNLPALAEGDDALGREVGEALWPDRYTREQLEHVRGNVDPWIWAALYQQRPAPGDGAIFLEAWLNQFWETFPNQVDLAEWAISLDATFKKTILGSFVVAQAWARTARGGQFYLRDQIRGRWEFSEARDRFAAFCRAYPLARIKLLEDAANGPAIESSLRTEIPGLVLVKVKGSKEARARGVSPYYKAGNVWLPHPRLYPWVRDYRAELITFPNGPDDQVDCSSQALDYLGQRSGTGGAMAVPARNNLNAILAQRERGDRRL